jgi:putative salt-induced outer membrane protein YdiY
MERHSMKDFETRAGRTCAAGLVVLSWVITSAGALAQTPEPAEPPVTWTGTMGAGVSVTSGNSDTMNYNLAFDVTRTPTARNVMKWTGLYLRGDQGGTVVVDRTLLGFRDEYTLSGRTFLFAQVDYFRDTFKRIDYLVAPTAGLGFKVIDTEPATFLINVGGGTVSEKNRGADLRTSGAVTAGEAVALQLTPSASLKQASSALWKANDFGDALYTFSVGLGTRISERLQLSVDLLDTFKTRPPTTETRRNDVALVTAITAKF